MNDNAAKVASQVVSGLQGSPVLLAMLALNAIGIGAALWFLNKLADAQAKRFDVILRACLPHIGGGGSP
jgi:hypothetical protein